MKMKKNFALAAVALMSVSMSLNAQDNPMTVFPDNYGENFRSISFDGARGETFTNSAIYFKGNKGANTYSTWGDTWGDVVVGAMENKVGGKIITGTLINDESLNINDYTVTMGISPKGVLSAYVARFANKGVIEVFDAVRAECVKAWHKSELSVNVDIKRLYAVGDKSLLIVAQDGKIYTTTKVGADHWSPVKSVSDATAECVAISVNGGGDVAVRIENKIYSYAGGKLTELMTISGEVKDFVADEDGSVNVVYTSGNKYYMKNNKVAKASTLPLKGDVKEVIIDTECDQTLYYTIAQDSITEVNKLALNGRRWVSSEVTVESPYCNRELVSVIGASSDEPVQICWLQETTEDIKNNALSAIKVDIAQPAVMDTTDKSQIPTLMSKVAEWQLTEGFPGNVKTKRDWHWGAFYEGLIKAYERTGDERFFNEMVNVGEYFDWELEPDVLHADRLLVCDIFAYLYDHTGRKDDEMIRSTRWAMNLHTSRQAKVEPQYKGANNKHEWWTWCDALFMATPSFYTYSNLTGDPAAMNFAFNQWKVITDYLFSEEDQLFFRDDRYFDQVSSNGGHIIWARGNGWVLGALPRIMSQLPADHPHRAYYEELFRKMCAKMLELQRPEGLWTVSLLDPGELLRGESSGSGFFGYAFAWGVNNGILDKEVYGEAAQRAWKALSANVSTFGRLGYVQQVAGSPYPFYENQAHTYASGAFLLFADEMLKME